MVYFSPGVVETWDATPCRNGGEPCGRSRSRPSPELILGTASTSGLRPSVRNAGSAAIFVACRQSSMRSMQTWNVDSRLFGGTGRSVRSLSIMDTGQGEQNAAYVPERRPVTQLSLNNISGSRRPVSKNILQSFGPFTAAPRSSRAAQSRTSLSSSFPPTKTRRPGITARHIKRHRSIATREATTASS